jgi:hypothetical protein
VYAFIRAWYREDGKALTQERLRTNEIIGIYAHVYMFTYLVRVVEASFNIRNHDVVLVCVVRMNIVPVSRPHALDARNLPLLDRSALASSSGGDDKRPHFVSDGVVSVNPACEKIGSMCCDGGMMHQRIRCNK